MEKRSKIFFRRITSFNALVALIYLIFRFFIRDASDFGPIPSSYQPLFQYLHILAVVPWVFGFGFLFSFHIYPKLKRGKNEKRKSGLTLTILALIMILSGYFLQIPLINREWASLIHTYSSLIWLGIYFYHLRQK